MTDLNATVRLQLHRDFDLRAAARTVPYYAHLGITHVYLSPIAAARPGSTHGYDVIDPTIVNPELGGETALGELVDALHRHRMGVIVDIVPNHMAADTLNPWWHDVLEHGQASRYACYFDIDWEAPAAAGRLWLPVLGEPLGDLIDKGELKLIGENDTIAIAYGPLRFPLSPDSRRGLSDADIGDAQRLRDVLQRQHYRLAWWRSGADVINYRRFFDIDGLAALAMDRPEVFDAVHALPLSLIERGWIDGLRLDHIDGVPRPRGYLRRLRHAVERARQRRGGATAVTLHVEKILAFKENLPSDWPVEGSTGYDFMDRAGALLHNVSAQSVLARAWHRCSGRPSSFRDEERRARQEWLDGGLRTDLARCVRQWQAYLAHCPEAGDITADALARAIGQMLEHMPVYRTYLGPGEPSRADRHALEHAFRAADACGPPDDREIRAWLRRQCLDVQLRHLPRPARTSLRLARQRLEQLAAPLNAKAVEDTAGYRYGPLLSRNEVGSDPDVFGISIDAFHRFMERRATTSPLSLSATATHDHKRGEDTRARLAVLSEHPAAWIDHLTDWIEQLRRFSPGPCAADIAMLLQTALAAWPLTLTDARLVDEHDEALAQFGERLEAWWIKALREARLRTRWTAPDTHYEARAQALVRRLFGDPSMSGLRSDLATAARRLDVPGALNGLTATALRLTAPGIPDLYQGTECWDQSLVDPDNRRPVDYTVRAAMLAAPAPVAELLTRFRDGAIKQAMIARLLALRQRSPELFRQGDYRPCRVTGPAIGHVVAFMRRYGDECLVVAVPRLCADWLADTSIPHVPAACWGDAQLLLDEASPRDLVDVLTNQPLPFHSDTPWQLSNLFSLWPVSVLHGRMQATR